MSSIQWIEHFRAIDTKLETQWSGYPPQQVRILTISFRIYYGALNHVAGIIYSTDGWKTRQEGFAAFKSACGARSDGELWTYQCQMPASGSFEYVIWCEDYRGIDSVKKIYKTDPINGGQPFIV